MFNGAIEKLLQAILDKITAKPADDADCPVWRAPCRQHRCRWYVMVSGTTPDGQTRDQWDCAMAWMPFMSVENAKQSRFASASADKVANEVRKLHNGVREMNGRNPLPDDPVYGQIAGPQ
jgi:hypothetical protein